MTEELKEATASRINDLHQIVLEGVENTKQNVQRTMQACVEIGSHIEEIPRGLRMAWLRDNCPNITEKQIAAYLSIAKTHKRRPENAIDGQFFALLGLTEQAQQHEKPTKGIGPNWLAWTGKLTGYFGEMTKQHPIETWDAEQREAVAAQLKPIAELYQKITGNE